METIRVLFLAANPCDTDALRLGEGVRRIFEAIESGTAREAFQFEYQLALRPSDLQRLLLKYEPHIVHFSGHGNEKGEIVFEDDQGNSRPIDKKVLANVLRLHSRTIGLVFLNAGFSSSQAEAISSAVDYTLGIDKAFGDTAAITFAAAFYG